MLLNLIKYQRSDIDKIYLYEKDLLLIHGREKVDIKKLKNPKAFIDYSQAIDDIYENLEVLWTELFLRGRKLNILLVFISQSYFKMPKTKGINATHNFIMKTPNKRELQHIAAIHSSDIDLKDFMKLYKDHTKEPYSF